MRRNPEKERRKSVFLIIDDDFIKNDDFVEISCIYRTSTLQIKK